MLKSVPLLLLALSALSPTLAVPDLSNFRRSTPAHSSPPSILQDSSSPAEIAAHQKRWEDLSGPAFDHGDHQKRWSEIDGPPWRRHLVETRDERFEFGLGGEGGMMEIVRLSGQGESDEESVVEKRALEERNPEALRDDLRTQLSRTPVVRTQAQTQAVGTPRTPVPTVAAADPTTTLYLTTYTTSSTTEYTQTTTTTTVTSTSTPIQAPSPTTTSTPSTTSTPKPTTTKTTSTTKAATTTSAASTGVKHGYTDSGLNLDTTHSGDGTYFDVGLGACGTYASNSDYIVAVSYLLFETYPGHTANPNKNPICNKRLSVTYGGVTIEVRVQDECMGCENPWSLDFSPTAFARLADPDVGRIEGVKWVFLD